MEVAFANERLHKACCNRKRAIRSWGKRAADKLALRLQQLEAAENLQVFHALPGGRCHVLRGNRAGQFGITLYDSSGLRLLVEPAGNRADFMNGNEICPQRVTSVTVLGVEDYHHG